MTNDLATITPQLLIQDSRPGQITGQASSDAEVLELWLFGRPPHTQSAYRADVAHFLAFKPRPLIEVTLRDLQAFSDSLTLLRPASRSRKLSALKSLLTFAQKIGYLPFNVGAAVRLPARPNDLAARIMEMETVLRVIDRERDPRNAAMLRLLYVSGIRVSELCGLRWRDLQPSADEETGQITVLGKGGKTRAVKLTAKCWKIVQAIRGSAAPEDPVFRSKLGGALSRAQVWRVVAAAARRAGLKAKVSPHWFRHAHASHTLDRGAPIHLVQATLGHANMAVTGRYSHARPTDSSSRYLPA